MIEKREKRKKIFYVPGMISLVFIPLFCLIYFYRTDTFKVYGALEFGLVPDKQTFEKYKVPVLRNYTTFNFEKNRSLEVKKLNQLKKFLKELVRTSDTINGAKIHFGPKTDYNTFVNVIEILRIQKVPTWAPYKDDIFALANKKIKNTRSFICGTRSIIVEEEREFTWLQLNFFKNHWILFIGYLSIVALNIFALVKFNKNR